MSHLPKAFLGPFSGEDSIIPYSFNFDGIACNDDSYYPQIKSSNSYIVENLNITGGSSGWHQQMGVEFWIRITKPLEQFQYLFNMYGHNSLGNYMTIYQSTDDQVVCAPFGIGSSSNPKVSYSGLNQTIIDTYGWIHLSCQYSYEGEIKGSIHKSAFLETYTTDLSRSPNYIQGDLYTVTIGNNYNMTQGAIGATFRELRIWNTTLDANIVNFRHKQVDPFKFQGTLLYYARLASGNFKIYNYMSALTGIDTFSTANNLVYVTDSDLTVCPPHLYYSNTRCYLNPYTDSMLAVLPDFDQQNSQLYWRISTNFSSLLSEELISEFITYWEIDDIVVQSIADTQAGNTDLVVPSYAFRDESSYNIKFIATNAENTFYETMSIQFVPVSCHWYQHDETNDFLLEKVFEESRGDADITLKFNLRTIQTYCSDILFYNTKVEDLIIRFTPEPEETI